MDYANQEEPGSKNKSTLRGGMWEDGQEMLPMHVTLKACVIEIATCSHITLVYFSQHRILMTLKLELMMRSLARKKQVTEINCPEEN